jgi:hypothetical protein
MTVLAAVLGLVLIAVVLIDAFETLVLPRRVDRSFRLAILFYRFTWRVWTVITDRVRSGRVREALLAGFGPASLLLLLGVWAVGLIVGFAALQWSFGPSIDTGTAARSASDITTALYLSGSTFFTLGYGDITPVSAPARALAVVEAGIGFAFLALVISYLPNLNGPLAERELVVTLLDARAGSPPSAIEVLRRYAGPAASERLHDLLVDWDRWSALVLESHLAYPVLAFFRSQHEHQSWVAALATVLDTCALLAADDESPLSLQARLTFATAHHAVVDLSRVFHVQPPDHGYADRLTAGEADQLRAALHPSVEPLEDAEGRGAAWEALDRRRALYEPHLEILASYLRMPLPRFIPPSDAVDDLRDPD